MRNLNRNTTVSQSRCGAERIKEFSLREYFATGFEAYYLGKQDALEKISPMLYDKINELHHYSEY